MRILIVLVVVCLAACGGSQAESTANNASEGQAEAQAETGIELVGIWALVMEDAELAFEVLPDGTALGIRHSFKPDGTGIVDHGEGTEQAFTWSRGADGELTIVYELTADQTNEATYRIEDLGDGRIKLVNVDHPEQDHSVYLRR